MHGPEVFSFQEKPPKEVEPLIKVAPERKTRCQAMPLGTNRQNQTIHSHQDDKRGFVVQKSTAKRLNAVSMVVNPVFRGQKTLKKLDHSSA
ncbi:MAG: hypothetical protein ACTS73_09655 [Arsenophonus sp. NEOnobi-MAG3]